MGLDPAKITRRLSGSVERLKFIEPVTHVYNPLQYAKRGMQQYLKRFARKHPEALLLGMNPGPFGMAQTGVPFGEVSMVRDWMGIEELIEHPEREHPKRPIQGFACTRSEVSGRRLWGWAKNRFESAELFFDRFFVWNFCPLLFMEQSGRNRTPDKLTADERRALYEICDEALIQMVEWFEPGMLIGVGKFAESRARTVLGDGIRVASILHPSPANPAANRGWESQVESQLRALGLEL